MSHCPFSSIEKNQKELVQGHTVWSIKEIFHVFKKSGMLSFNKPIPNRKKKKQIF